jgi:ribosomal RNA small subunit methyltransferase A
MKSITTTTIAIARMLSSAIMLLTMVHLLFFFFSISRAYSFQQPIQSRRHIIPIHESPSTRQQYDDKNDAFRLNGWVQGSDGEWEWEEDDPTSAAATLTTTLTPESIDATATPSLPGGSFRPKQSLGQNFLRDGNTVAKIVKAFVKDATETLGITDVEKRDLKLSDLRSVELGPGAGALTDVLVPALGCNNLQCIEIDPRSVELLGEKHPNLRVHHLDVLQADYPTLADEEGGPLSIIGNLPYYITSQILFALADASHTNAVRSATVTMQWEVGKRIVAPTRCKDYGILSVVFQLYADCKIHFKIPPTVFYPQPKVDSALIGLHFLGPTQLRKRLAGVSPSNLRSVVTATFQQRRKTVRNGLKQLALTVYGGDKERVQKFLDSEPLPLPQSVQEAKDAGDEFAMAQQLPLDWVKKRPEELSPGQFVEITRLLYGTAEAADETLGRKVWRKLKHGT